MLLIIHLLEGCTVQFPGRSVPLTIVVLAIISSFIGLSISSTGLPSISSRPTTLWFTWTIGLDVTSLTTSVTYNYWFRAIPTNMPWEFAIVTYNILCIWICTPIGIVVVIGPIPWFE